MAVQIFRSVPAIDPQTGQLVTNGEGTIYAADDTNLTTPLAVTDLSGNALASIPTGPNGLSAAFMVELEDGQAGQVKWVSGQFSMMMQSFEALREIVQNAANSAAVAVSQAVLSVQAGSNVTITGDPKNPTISATGGGGGGTGSVDSVNGVEPDESGDVTITPGTIGALPADTTFTVEQISGLSTALTQKANLSHSHSIDGITGLPAALSALQPAGDYATSAELEDGLEAKLNTAGTAAAASKLATTRTISFSGDATGSFTFDGSANVSASLALAAAAGGGNVYLITDPNADRENPITGAALPTEASVLWLTTTAPVNFDSDHDVWFAVGN